MSKKIYTRRLKKNIGNIVILLLNFANLVKFSGRLTINGYIEKSLSMNKRIAAEIEKIRLYVQYFIGIEAFSIPTEHSIAKIKSAGMIQSTSRVV